MGKNLTILISGMLASDPHQGGASWAILQYLLGLARLGHEAYFVEPLQPGALQPSGALLNDSINAAYFKQILTAFGLDGRATLLLAGSQQTVGLRYEEVCEVARRADLLLNVSGMLAQEELISRIPVRVYLDLDPAFNQLWHAVQNIDMRFAGHTHFVTVGLALDQPDCSVPTCGLPWITSLQPVVLEHWSQAGPIVHDGFTTVGNWRGYGSIEHNGVLYGQKAHSLRALIDLPTRIRKRFLPALAIHPDEKRDLEALRVNGWEVLDPAEVAGTPERYQRFLRGSWAELGIAKSGYVASRCGWFSDRSICYLASGRPVLAQDTGFSRFLPTGEGLFAFRTAEDVQAVVQVLDRDYDGQCRAARALAEELFDSDKVLRRFLQSIGVAP
jgi:hypothetical protein